MIQQLPYVSVRDTHANVIRSFKNAEVKEALDGVASKGFPADILKIARRKLAMLHAAVKLDDLRSPPGNRLEALRGDRKGQHSIRVNDKFRICFVWTEEGPAEVEFTDYH